MSERPRKQHFVPAFYLAGFTLQRSANDVLWVLDRSQRRQWQSTPRHAAKETDFYCGDFGPDADAFSVERTLASCEAKWARVIQRIIDSSSLPEDEEDDVKLRIVETAVGLAVVSQFLGYGKRLVGPDVGAGIIDVDFESLRLVVALLHGGPGLPAEDRQMNSTAGATRIGRSPIALCRTAAVKRMARWPHASGLGA